jgi:hypothetical protein
MDDDGRRRDVAHGGGAVARGEDRAELARRAARVQPAVEHQARDLAQLGVVALEAVGADRLEQRDRVVDECVALARRLPEEDRHHAEGRLADAPRARGGHDRCQREHTLRAGSGERLGDHPAHRRADDVCGLDAEAVEQPGGVVGHVLQTVGGRRAAHEQLRERRRRRILEMRRAADVTVVEADDVEALADELGAEVLVPGDHLGTQAHDQQQGRVARVAEGLVAEADAAADVAEPLVHATQPIHARSRVARCR